VVASMFLLAGCDGAAARSACSAYASCGSCVSAGCAWCPGGGCDAWTSSCSVIDPAYCSASGWDGGSGLPAGAAECEGVVLAHRSEECGGAGDAICGDGLLCSSPLDCLTCSYRCTPTPCTSDGDCEGRFGALCTGVEWRCEPYITDDYFGCFVYDEGAPRCGDDACEGHESCSSCPDDCGYCPGEAPLGAPCTADAQCATGDCAPDGWCSRWCSTYYDCDDDFAFGISDVWLECVEIRSGERLCAPACNARSCDDYAGTSCVPRYNEFGSAVNVCVR